ncbi:hypothetical protein AB870_02780 [Pandoraea faecigallinarum]|uniref:Uncharacterized protein n=1 Tax=Pandoraea faecigallinarum TaxID=656179 RepID=A0A0H3WRU1_9BURK|nr:hypothetical protein [Pandoraea faecigallinarum]AKM29283.1 hypothetical protein AB870_02780 [Pandoraea faecigallinarum]
MDISVITAIAGGVGAIIGSMSGAMATLIAARMGVKQRQREQLVERAYDAAAAEYRAHVDARQANIDAGNSQNIAAFSRYLVYHLTFIGQITDLNRVHKLDANAVTHALDEATRMARVSRSPDLDAGA